MEDLYKEIPFGYRVQEICTTKTTRVYSLADLYDRYGAEDMDLMERNIHPTLQLIGEF